MQRSQPSQILMNTLMTWASQVWPPGVWIELMIPQVWMVRTVSQQGARKVLVRMCTSQTLASELLILTLVAEPFPPSIAPREVLVRSAMERVSVLLIRMAMARIVLAQLVAIFMVWPRRQLCMP